MRSRGRIHGTTEIYLLQVRKARTQTSGDQRDGTQIQEGSESVLMKLIGDKLSALIDWLDAWLDEEFEYFRGLFPYRGRRYKK